MTQDSDGVNEVMDGSMRVALTLAGQVGERLAREQEQAARAAQTASEADARAMQTRLAAERAVARSQLAPLEHAAWWDKANVQQITDALRVAVTWQAVDPQAAAAVAVIRQQVQERFGVEVEQPRSDPIRVGEADSQNVRNITRERTRMERAEAAQVLAADDRSQAASTYDSRERREQRAGGMERAGVEPEVIGAVMLADVSQARPAVDATAGSSPRNPTQTRLITPIQRVQLER